VSELRPFPAVRPALASTAPTIPLTVIVPARNAEEILEECLASIAESNPAQIIVVDGNSTDRTVEIARKYASQVLNDEGKGLPAARLMGAQAATQPLIALIDADVVLHTGALRDLIDEFEGDGYDALQAGQHSVAGPGYWGQALVQHHRNSRSKSWFGLVATIIGRDTLLEHGFDAAFVTGEDIEFRWRLARAGLKLGVSTRTVVAHRFGDTFGFARDQWLMDGHGLGRMVVKHPLRGARLLALPAAAAARGSALALARREPRWLPYFALFAAYNYVGMGSEIGKRLTTR
jgi:glycosyltransferase involved in cell wall biosynthesis